MKKEKIKNAKTFDQLLDIKYGVTGTKSRDEFEKKAQYFVISEMLKEGRKQANLTQEQLAERANRHWTYIGGIERGERNVTLQVVADIARALGVEIQTLFPRERD